jgi:Ca2+-binding RTX toxin-like protein
VVIVDNDIYIGGAGNDTIEIQVSYGSDIIVFNKGDGHDTIRNDNNNTVLQLGEGFSKSDIKFVADGNYFYITFINSPGDSIFVDAEYGSSKYYLQTMKFHDGSTLDISPNNINNVIYRGGGTGNDRIHGDFYVSGLGQIPSADIISGYDGNDHLYGGEEMTLFMEGTGMTGWEMVGIPGRMGWLLWIMIFILEGPATIP